MRYDGTLGLFIGLILLLGGLAWYSVPAAVIALGVLVVTGSILIHGEKKQ